MGLLGPLLLLGWLDNGCLVRGTCFSRGGGASGGWIEPVGQGGLGGSNGGSLCLALPPPPLGNDNGSGSNRCIGLLRSASLFRRGFLLILNIDQIDLILQVTELLLGERPIANIGHARLFRSKEQIYQFLHGLLLLLLNLPDGGAHERSREWVAKNLALGQSGGLGRILLEAEVGHRENLEYLDFLGVQVEHAHDTVKHLLPENTCLLCIGHGALATCEGLELGTDQTGHLFQTDLADAQALVHGLEVGPDRIVVEPAQSNQCTSESLVLGVEEVHDGRIVLGLHVNAVALDLVVGNAVNLVRTHGPLSEHFQVGVALCPGSTASLAQTLRLGAVDQEAELVEVSEPDLLVDSGDFGVVGKVGLATLDIGFLSFLEEAQILGTLLIEPGKDGWIDGYSDHADGWKNGRVLFRWSAPGRLRGVMDHHGQDCLHALQSAVESSNTVEMAAASGVGRCEKDDIVLGSFLHQATLALDGGDAKGAASSGVGDGEVVHLVGVGGGDDWLLKRRLKLNRLLSVLLGLMRLLGLGLSMSSRMSNGGQCDTCVDRGGNDGLHRVVAKQHVHSGIGVLVDGGLGHVEARDEQVAEDNVLILLLEF